LFGRKEVNPLIEVLMERDELTREEAQELIDGARAEIAEGEDPEEILFAWGLEPDYLEDLLG
jgi:hypothetical protein